MGDPNTRFDRRSFLKSASGAAVIATTAGCTGSGDGDDDGISYDDPEDAGDPVPSFTYYNNPEDYNPSRHDAINLNAERFREVGFDVEVEVMEWSTLLTNAWVNYDFDMVSWNQYMGTDPGEHAAMFWDSENADEPGTGNIFGFKDDRMDELIDLQLKATDLDKRAEHFHEIQDMVAEQVPWQPILVLSNLMPHRNDQLEGWVDHIEGYNRLTNYVNVETLSANDDGFLRGFWTEALENMNPWAHGDLSKHIHLFDALFDKVVHFTPDLEPDFELSLADSIERPDLSTAVYELTDDATWSDGEPLTAEDVAFTYNTIVEEEVPQYATQGGVIEDAEVIDEYTVQLNLSQEIGVALNPLVPNLVYIAPKHVWEGVSAPFEKLVEEPVGSGIMEVDFWDPGQEINLVARDDHRLDFDIEGINWQIIPETSTIWELTDRGDINYHPFSQASKELSEGEEGDNLSISTAAGDGWLIFAMNTRKDGLSELPVRRALAHSLPKTPINEQLFYGYHQPGWSFVTPGFGPYHNPDVRKYEGGVEGAIEQLQDEGYVVTEDGVHYSE